MNKLLKPKGFLFLATAALSRAIGVQLFLIPNSIVLGGVTGLASLIEILWGDMEFFSACYFVLIINVPLLILAYFLVGKKLTARTVIYLFMTALFMWLIRFFDLSTLLGANNPENKTLYAIIGGILEGVSLPLMLSIHGSTGGSDIVAMLVKVQKKRNSTGVMRSILFMDMVVMTGASFALWSFDCFVYSLVALFASEIVGELIYRGYSAATVLEIVTDKPAEVSKALMTNLSHGVTDIKVHGVHSNVDRIMVICVVFKRQLTAARKIVRSVDPNAFAYVLNVNEVVGLGFRNKEEELEKND